MIVQQFVEMNEFLTGTLFLFSEKIAKATVNLILVECVLSRIHQCQKKTNQALVTHSTCFLCEVLLDLIIPQLPTVRYELINSFL